MVARAPSVSILPGDTFTFPTYGYKANSTAPFIPYDFDAEGWSDWYCCWAGRNGQKIDLDITQSDPSIGLFRIVASAQDTANMTQIGSWLIRGTNAGEVRSWLWGRTIPRRVAI